MLYCCRVDMRGSRIQTHWPPLVNAPHLLPSSTSSLLSHPSLTISHSTPLTHSLPCSSSSAFTRCWLCAKPPAPDSQMQFDGNKRARAALQEE